MVSSHKKHLIVIAGPTAVGKTALSVNLAKALRTEIVSADSRQFYKELNIGTAKPSREEMNGITHHFINNLSIHEDYNVGKYEEEVLQLLDHLFTKHNTIILTGGSGLFIKAVCEGFDELPEVDLAIREELNQTLETKGLDYLTEELKKCDPVFYEQVDLQNPQRVLRALEVFQSTGVPFSTFRTGLKKERAFKTIKIGLSRERKELYERINFRMDEMLKQGLEGEVQGLINYQNKNALQTVGYKEIFDFLNQEYDREEMIRLLKRNSRRYAKRQLTWFNKDKDFTWFHPDQEFEILTYIRTQIKID